MNRPQHTPQVAVDGLKKRDLRATLLHRWSPLFRETLPYVQTGLRQINIAALNALIQGGGVHRLVRSDDPR